MDVILARESQLRVAGFSKLRGLCFVARLAFVNADVFTRGGGVCRDPACNGGSLRGFRQCLRKNSARRKSHTTCEHDGRRQCPSAIVNSHKHMLRVEKRPRSLLPQGPLPRFADPRGCAVTQSSKWHASCEVRHGRTTALSARMAIAVEIPATPNDACPRVPRNKIKISNALNSAWICLCVPRRSDGVFPK